MSKVGTKSDSSGRSYVDPQNLEPDVKNYNMAIAFLLREKNDIEYVIAWDGVSNFILGSEWFSPSTKYKFYKDEEVLIRWDEMVKDGTPFK